MNQRENDMCYCTPERRTPFCSGCAWKLAEENAALKAENLRLVGEVVNRNRRAMEGDQHKKAFNDMYDNHEALRVELEALKAELAEAIKERNAFQDQCISRNIKEALKSQESVAQAPIATLHDDGYWLFTKDATEQIKAQSRQAGWRLSVYAAPQPAAVPAVPVSDVLKILRLMSSGVMTPNSEDGWKAALDIYAAPEAPQAQDKDGERHVFLKGVLYAAGKYEASRSERFTGGDVSDFLTMEAHELSADDIDQAMKGEFK